VTTDAHQRSHRCRLIILFVVLLAAFGFMFARPEGAYAQSTTTVAGPTAPNSPTSPTGAGTNATASNGVGTNGGATTTTVKPALSVDLAAAASSATGQGAGTLQIVVIITVISVAPAILMLVTAFTRIVIVLGLTRNAIGVQGVPPNQVLIGLSLFLTIFVMGPTFSKANSEGLQPYLRSEISQTDALSKVSAPFKTFMLEHVREKDVAVFVDLSKKPAPATPQDLPLTTLVPAFAIGELRAAFLIGFVVFIPFLIIDMITSATLTSMGMVMVQPATVALPFKLLLFVLVDGWQLLSSSLIRSFG
jgi:flagellar biosynthetic protein FliP